MSMTDKDERTLALAEAVTDLDDDLLAEAHADKPRRLSPAAIRWMAAACTVLVVGAVLWFSPLTQRNRWGDQNNGDMMPEKQDPGAPADWEWEEYPGTDFFYSRTDTSGTGAMHELPIPTGQPAFPGEEPPPETVNESEAPAAESESESDIETERNEEETP